MITGLSNIIKIIGDIDKNNDNEGKNRFGVFSRKKEGREMGGNYGQYFQKALLQREAKKGVVLMASVRPREIYFFKMGKIIIRLYVDGNKPFVRKWIKTNFCRRETRTDGENVDYMDTSSSPLGIYLLKTPHHLSCKVSHSLDVVVCISMV